MILSIKGQRYNFLFYFQKIFMIVLEIMLIKEFHHILVF